MRQAKLNTRCAGDTTNMTRWTRYNQSKYIDQVEIIKKSHLVQSLHNESEDIVVFRLCEEYGLNTEQDRAFHIVTQHSSNPMAQQLRMYAGDMGGTGKTRILNALTSYFCHQGESKWLIAVAPTGTAAALVKGLTYHFMFDINECQGNSMSKKSMAEVKERLAGIDYIFMDEVSMLLYTDLYKISSHLSII